jgi:iron complex outermembrane receptor protein
MAIRHRIPTGLASLALCSVGFAQQAVKLDIDAQPLDRALNAWATQTGYQVLIPVDRAARGRTSPHVKGHYTPEGALKVLLASSQLKYEFVNERTVTIRNADPPSASQPTPPESDRKRERTAPLALAQSRPRETQAAARVESSNAAQVEQGRGRNNVEEVIVTAQKRSQRALDVPISISVVTPEDIDRRRLFSAEDYLRGVPGANQSEGMFGQTIVIRGIETTTSSQNFYSGTTVATYFGETPTSNTAGLGGGTNVDIKLVDVERVEVLRGPQGTAFGNSSMGGTVRTIPAAPDVGNIEARFAASYSRTSEDGGDNYSAQAVGNLPIIDGKLAVRAVGYLYEEAGFYRNVAGSDAAFRAAAATPYGADAFGQDESDIGAYYVRGARASALFQATDNLSLLANILTQKSETDGTAVHFNGSSPYEQTLLQIAPEHVVRGQRTGQMDRDLDIANATVQYNLGWGDLVGTYSYIDSGSTVSYPYTGLGAAFLVPASTYAPSDHRENVAEVRLNTRLHGAWNFLVGVYAEKLDDNVLYDERWYGTPETNIYAPGQSILGIFTDQRTLKQKAVFGEVYWDFAPRWTFTGGVRAYEYDRDYEFHGVGAYWATPGSSLDVTKSATDSGENFRANLSYKVTDDGLLYAGWAQGFRVGQLQRTLPPGRCDVDNDGMVDGTDIDLESTGVVAPDNVDSFEVGGKFALFQRRLTVEANVFRMDWTDIPVAVRAGVLGVNCGLPYTANAGEARSEGLELQSSVQVTDPLRIDFGGSYTRARLTADAPAAGAFKGNRLPGAPRVSANFGIQYEFDIAGHSAYVRTDSIYVGHFYGNLQESPTTEAGGYVKLDASARLSIRNINIDLFIRNLTNEDAYTYRGNNARSGEIYGYRLRPRTVGLQVGYSF